jgi:hypothetical protein
VVAAPSGMEVLGDLNEGRLKPTWAAYRRHLTVSHSVLSIQPELVREEVDQGIGAGYR